MFMNTFEEYLDKLQKTIGFKFKPIRWFATNLQNKFKNKIESYQKALEITRSWWNEKGSKALAAAKPPEIEIFSELRKDKDGSFYGNIYLVKDQRDPINDKDKKVIMDVMKKYGALRDMPFKEQKFKNGKIVYKSVFTFTKDKNQGIWINRFKHNVVDEIRSLSPNYAVSSRIPGWLYDTDLQENNNMKMKQITSESNFKLPDGIEFIDENTIDKKAKERLTSIAIPNTVKTIGKRAFFDCRKLRSVTIPDSVTTIDTDAFCDCVNLTSINIPNSVTMIGEDVFMNCYSLESIEIPSSMKYIPKSMFDNCRSLVSVTIPSSIQSIRRYAFSGCDSLESIVLPDGLKIIGDMIFANDENLQSVTIPDSVVKVNWDIFMNCPKLKTVYCSERIWNKIVQGVHFGKDNTFLDNVSRKDLHENNEQLFKEEQYTIDDVADALEEDDLKKAYLILFELGYSEEDAEDLVNSYFYVDDADESKEVIKEEGEESALPAVPESPDQLVAKVVEIRGKIDSVAKSVANIQAYCANHTDQREINDLTVDLNSGVQDAIEALDDIITAAGDQKKEDKKAAVDAIDQIA